MDVKQALPSLVIKGKTIKVPIIQGGMGVGVSLRRLPVLLPRKGASVSYRARPLTGLFRNVRVKN